MTPKDLPDFARISLVEASPLRPGTAYVAANRYQHDDFAPYVYRTDDYGETWTKIVNGIAPRDFARAIREDPTRAKLLYLGTEHGIYVSFDDGANWQSLRQNLPDVPVHDLKVDGARSRDRDARPRVLRDGRHLAAAAVGRPDDRAARSSSREDVLRGLDRTLAIDYVLKQPAEKVTIEFLDGTGKVIRTFSRHRGRLGEAEGAAERSRTSSTRRTRSRPRSRGCSG